MLFSKNIKNNLDLTVRTIKYFENRGFTCYWTGEDRPEWSPTPAGFVLVHEDDETGHKTVSLATITGVITAKAEFDVASCELGLDEAAIRKFYEHIEKLESDGLYV